jgi:hypothetical protein
MFRRELYDNPIIANKHLYKLLEKHHIYYMTRSEEGDFEGFTTISLRIAFVVFCCSFLSLFS